MDEETRARLERLEAKLDKLLTAQEQLQSLRQAGPALFRSTLTAIGIWLLVVIVLTTAWIYAT